MSLSMMEFQLYRNSNLTPVGLQFGSQTELFMLKARALVAVPKCLGLFLSLLTTFLRNLTFFFRRAFTNDVPKFNSAD
jgi:hypothetical protein